MDKPKKPTPEQFAKIKEKYTSLRENVSRVGGLVLEMARHPDATDAEILEVAMGYRKYYATLRAIHENCKTNFPRPYTTLVAYPWEKPL